MRHLTAKSRLTMGPGVGSVNAANPWEPGRLPYKTFQCATCGFIYDEAEGLPDEGFPPGTRWADIPKTWNCPDCGMSKVQFDMIEFE